MAQLEDHDRCAASFCEEFESIAYACIQNGERDLADELMKQQAEFVAEVRAVLSMELGKGRHELPEAAFHHILSPEHVRQLEERLRMMVLKTRRRIDTLRMLQRIYHPPYAGAN